MNVSYYNYRRMNRFLRADIRNELEILLSLDKDEDIFHYQYINEKKIGKQLGKGYAKGTASGTAALQLSLTALGVKKGDEVITVPNTYIATLHAITNTFARPVLVDISEDTMLMDSDMIEDAINERTKAIMPVHLYGQMADMHNISKIAKKHKLYIIEDACQSHFARYNRKLPGSKSDAACYSFFPNKNLGGIGNGGMVLTKKRGISKKIETLRNPTSNDPLLLKSLRTPAYLDAIQIAFIKCKLKYAKEWIKKKKDIVERYYEAFNGLPIRLLETDKGADNTFMDFPIRVKKRDKLQRYMKKKGIQAVVHYHPAVHLSKTYKHLGYGKGDFPVAERCCDTVLSIPTNPFMKQYEVEYVISNIKRAFNNHSFRG